MNKIYLNANELKEIYGISRTTAWRLLKAKKVESVLLKTNDNQKHGKRLYIRASIDDYFASLRQPANPLQVIAC